MYKAFEINVTHPDAEKLAEYLSACGRNAIKKNVSQAEMASAVKSSSANWIMDTWFKDYAADVFVSYSSEDKKIAEGFAAILESEGLRVFIDSDVWGRAEALQRIIYDSYASVKKDSGVVDHYLYEKRNNTTGYVHAMLHFALTRMINQAECFVFLSTSNSKLSSNQCSLETKSPWLFYELATANFVAEIEPNRRRLLIQGQGLDAGLEKVSESFSVKFRVETPKLKTINLDDICKAIKISRSCGDAMPQFILDRLYCKF